MYLQKALSRRRIAVIKWNLGWAALDMQASTIYLPCGAPISLYVDTLDGREYISRIIQPFKWLFTKCLNYKVCLVFDIPFTMGTQNFMPYLCEINNLNTNVTCILILWEH